MLSLIQQVSTSVGTCILIANLPSFLFSRQFYQTPNRCSFLKLTTASALNHHHHSPLPLLSACSSSSPSRPRAWCVGRRVTTGVFDPSRHATINPVIVRQQGENMQRLRGGGGGPGNGAFNVSFSCCCSARPPSSAVTCCALLLCAGCACTY